MKAMQADLELSAFSRLLRERREALGMTQRQVADRLGMSRTKYALMENRGAAVGAASFASMLRALSLLGLDLVPRSKAPARRLRKPEIGYAFEGIAFRLPSKQPISGKK